MPRKVGQPSYQSGQTRKVPPTSGTGDEWSTRNSVYELVYADLNTTAAESAKDIAPHGKLLPGAISTHPLIAMPEDTKSRRGSSSYGIRGIGSDFDILPSDFGSGMRSTTGIRNIQGTDDRVQVTDASKYPFSSHCLLIGKITSTSGLSGTGWPVAPRVLITAGHCVLPPQTGQFIMGMDVYLAPTAGKPAQPAAKAVRVETTKLWSQSQSQAADFAVVYLDRDICSDNDTFEPKIMTDAQLTNLRVNIVGYPGDKPLGTMWMDSNLIVSASRDQLHYLVDTMGGNSGGPVVYVEESTDNVYSIGIHNYGGGGFNTATRITQTVLDQIEAWTSERP